ncbi:hypothetical protein B0J14DRAFT_25308 [Halenospora varia]|nr:hypothetical protein B0J14DRAFT_25308 [Halenospora varia]
MITSSLVLSNLVIPLPTHTGAANSFFQRHRYVASSERFSSSCTQNSSNSDVDISRIMIVASPNILLNILSGPVSTDISTLNGYAQWSHRIYFRVRGNLEIFWLRILRRLSPCLGT